MKINYNDSLSLDLANNIAIDGNINPFIGIVIRYLLGSNLRTDNEKLVAKISSFLTNNPSELINLVKELIPYGLLDKLTIRYQYSNKSYKSREEENKFSIIKFKFIDNKLYVYDQIQGKENQKMIEVKKINGTNIQEIIDKFKNEGFNNKQIEILIMHKELLNCLGIPGNRYDLSLINNDDEITFEMDNKDIKFDFSIFRKEHTKSKILNKDNFSLVQNISIQIEDKRIAYSYDSNLKLLALLHGLSKSQKDLNLFNHIYSKEKEIIQYEENSDMYLDWMFISSFFIFNKEEQTTLPDYVYSELERKLKSQLNYKINEETLESSFSPLCIFLDIKNEEVSYPFNINETNYGVNGYIFKNREIDYRLLFHCIRNSLAHSSYEVIDNDYIRVYGFDENNTINFNIKIKKYIIIEFIDKLSDYQTFGNIYPICTLENPNYENISINNQEELKKYLKNIIVSNINITKYYDLDMMKKLNFLACLSIKENKINENNYKILDILEYDYSRKIQHLKFMLQNPITKTSQYIEQITKNQLKYYIDYDYENYKLNDTQIDSIMKKMELYSDTFFNHSAINQHFIVTELVKNELNPNRNISKVIHDIIKNSSKTQGTIIDYLGEEPTKYIDYDKIIKATIITYLNNILLYSYNENKSLNYSSLDFSNMIVNKDSLIKRKNARKINLKQENGNYRCTIKNKEKHINNLNIRLNHTDDSNKEKIKKEIKAENEKLELLKAKYPFEIITKNNQEISDIEEEISSINNNEFNLNSYILEHLRNSLAHGNMNFSSSVDINDIGSIELLFTDYYPKSGRESFFGKIKFADLLSVLSEEKFVSSLFSIDKLIEKKAK